MAEQRVAWVDKLKAIGIISVVLGHIQSPFGFFIFSWHMPLFFFVSGFFISDKKSIKQFVKRDFARLMVPYFIFAILGFIFETLKRILLNRESLDYIFELRGIFVYMDYPNLINTYGFVLWFLPALFFGRLFVYIINKKIKSILVQSILVLFLFYISFPLDIFFGIDNALNSILFIFIGSIFYKYYQNEKKLYILPLIFPIIIFYFEVPALDMASKNFENITVNILFSMSLIYMLFKLLVNTSINSKLVTLWGSNTMILFIIHPYTNHIGHILFGNDILFGNWHLKFFISLVLLQIILYIKQRFTNRGIFKYV